MDKKGILIIGAGGVSRVATVKWAMNIDTFEKITLASRTISKCETIRDEIKENQTSFNVPVQQLGFAVAEAVALTLVYSPELEQ